VGQQELYKSYVGRKTEQMFEDLDSLAKYLDESYDYVMSLESK